MKNITFNHVLLAAVATMAAATGVAVGQSAIIAPSTISTRAEDANKTQPAPPVRNETLLRRQITVEGTREQIQRDTATVEAITGRRPANFKEVADYNSSFKLQAASRAKVVAKTIENASDVQTVEEIAVGRQKQEELTRARQQTIIPVLLKPETIVWRYGENFPIFTIPRGFRVSLTFVDDSTGLPIKPLAGEPEGAGSAATGVSLQYNDNQVHLKSVADYEAGNVLIYLDMPKSATKFVQFMPYYKTIVPTATDKIVTSYTIRVKYGATAAMIPGEVEDPDLTAIIKAASGYSFEGMSPVKPSQILVSDDSGPWRQISKSPGQVFRSRTSGNWILITPNGKVRPYSMPIVFSRYGQDGSFATVIDASAARDLLVKDERTGQKFRIVMQ